MALHVDRLENFVVTDFFMNEVAEAGSVVVFDTTTTGVGSSLDDSNAVVKLPDNANGSGELPAGILVGDVVNKDLTQTHLNQHKRESQVGGKVGLVRGGSDYITTNMIHTGATPSQGATAYFDANGLLHTTSTNSTKIGTFLSGKDSDGYAKVHVQLG